MKKDRMIGFRILRGILKPIFLFYYNPKIYGKENIPEKGSLLICANHIHLMDQCLPLVSTKRIVKYMAKKEYWDSYKTRWFFKMAGCIPVNRQIKDEKAKNAALEYLTNGGAIGIFPEGTRNKTNEIIQPFKFGAISMAQKTNALIVPCGIYGDYKFRSNNLVIVIGKPFTVDKNDDLEKVNNEFQQKIVNLILEAKVISENKKS